MDNLLEKILDSELVGLTEEEIQKLKALFIKEVLKNEDRLIM